MWFVFAIITALSWGAADIFYKKGALPNEKYSHLKICVFVGIVMGIHAIYVLLTKDINYDPINIIYYFPVSFCYMISMALVFFGIRFIEDSIATPIENSSGAVTAVLCFLILGQRMSVLSLVGVILVTIGVVLLGYFENTGDTDRAKKLGSKKLAVVAFLMPVCYSIFNAVGGLLDAYFLDYTVSPLKNVTEETIELVANTSYELTFLILAIVFIIFIKLKKERLDVPKQKDKIIAAILETLGQFAYVFAMSGNAIVAAPIVSSVCVISVVLARIFLKEKLERKQYIAISSVATGILILAFAGV
ncbi:MAG: DMT family transporter [Clostridia bacterium]|nr:DMT family transporter [Clostridia bacterium]